MLISIFYSRFKKLILVLGVFVCVFLVGNVSAQVFSLQEGKKLFEQEEFEKAREVLLKVVEQEPKNAEANFLLCKILLNLDDHDKAIKYGEKAVELDGSVSNYHLWLGRAYGIQAQKGSKLKAIFRAKKCKGEYEKAISLDSANVSAQVDLMQYLLIAPGIAGGDKDKAKKECGIIQNLDSLFGAMSWAVYWQQEKDSVKAENYLKTAVRLDTTFHHLATYQLGSFLVDQKRYIEAAEVYEKLFQKYSNELSALYLIGRCYFFAKDSLNKAEMCFKLYLQIKPKKNEPTWSAAHWRLGMVYDLQGKKDLAIAELEEAVRLDPESKQYKKTLEEVKKKK